MLRILNNYVNFTQKIIQMKQRVILIALLSLFSLLFTGCGNRKGAVLKKVKYEKVVGDCQNDICVNINLSYFQMEGETDVANNFNALMEKMVFGKMALDSDSGNTSKEKLVENIIKDYQDFKKEFPDAATGGYEQKTDCEITYLSDNLISVKVVTEIYSGGAHSSHLEEFLNVNPETGKRKDIMDFITEKEKFSAYVEGLLRKKLKMSEKDKWSDFTFMDKFTLPENMGMTSGGLELIYNEYEILPYSEGLTVLEIDNKKLREFMKLP